MKRSSLFVMLTVSCALAMTVSQASNYCDNSLMPQAASKTSVSPGIEGAQAEITASPEVTGTIVRTLVYHELTGLPPGGVFRDYPLISGDGSRVVYALNNHPSPVYVTNFDGTGTRTVDSFQDQPKVDISYDGSTVLVVQGGGTGFGSSVRVYKEGSAGVTVWDKAGIGDIRLAPDGAQVFFQLRGDVSSDFKSGLWVVSANGGAPQRIVSPEQLATVVGLTVNDLSFDNSGIPCLDVSQDGTRFTFMVRVQSGMRVFAGRYVGGSLQGLHQILEPYPNYGVGNIVISSDGTKVGYAVRQPANTSITEVGVINFDNVNGQGKELLVTSDQFSTWPNDCFPGGGCASYRIFVNRDGSKLLLGASSYLYDTLTHAVIQLGVEIPQWSGDSPHLVYNGFFVPSMNAAATRFTYINRDANGVEQLATCEMTSSLGAAPSLSLPTIDPPFVLTNDRSMTALTVKTTASTGVNRVSGAFLRNGLDDPYVCVGDRQKPALLDNGTQGDTTAGDTIYTNNAIHAVGGALAVPGPRVVRYQAETITSDNKRHVTAIDVESLTVTEQTPLIDVAPTSLEFGDVAVNQSKDLTLTVRNIGQVALTINSLEIDNTRFSTPSTTPPVTLNAGTTQTITVRFSPTATGQQRGILTIKSTDPARPIVTVALAGNGVSTGGVTVLDHTMTGGPIPGACDKPTTKTTFAPTDTEAIQWTSASGLSVGDVIRWEWVQPNGSVYRQFDHTLQQVAQGQACFWDAIQIAGQQAATLPGNWQVRVLIKGVQVLTENFTISSGSACPTVSGINPTSGAVGASVTITGTNLTGVTVKFPNNVTATITSSSNTSLTVTVPSGAVSGSVTIIKPNCSDVQTGAFTVTQPTNRIVRAVCPSATAGGTLTIPIELVSQGDENALGFSLTFDPAVLSNPQATRGSDAGSALLNTNSSQAAQGRFGLALALASNTTFAAGTRQIAVVTFSVSATTTATVTTIDFGDTPIVRQVSNANAQAVPATYQACATVPITRGYEADVTPRPNGKNDSTIAITDWVQVGRFAAGLDTAAVGSEFQRADCAPRETKGDGQITITDWVQAGRYASALDAPQTCGGPTAPASGFAFAVRAERGFNEAATGRTLRVVNTAFVRGQVNALTIELDAQGDENAVGFSLTYDPTLMSYDSTALGSATTNALLMVNANQTANGKLGIALALPAGERFAAGIRALVTVRFNAAPSSAAEATTINFADQPIRCQVSDANASALTATYTNATIALANGLVCTSGASYYTTGVASEAIITAWGTGLATTAQGATTVPLPTSLAGTTVKIKDSTGTERLAPLFYVSPWQINYLMPPGVATGTVTVTIMSGDGKMSLGTMPVVAVAPGLFTANADGQGVAAAIAVRVKPDWSQSYETVAQFDGARWVSRPIDLGPLDELVVLLLYGTGLRYRSSLAAVTATIGGVSAHVDYAGVQPDFVGLDQINIFVPRSLIGRGEVDIVLTVDGYAANTIKINIR